MIRCAVGAVAQQFADVERRPLVGDDFRVIGEQRRRHGGGVRRHAGAEIEGDAVEMIARPGRAIATAFLQAGDVRIAEIPAARALGEVAAECREVADLRRGQAERRRGDARIGRADARVGGNGGDGGEGADGGRAVGAPAYADGVGRGGKIDQRSGRDAAAPPFAEIGAGGAEFGRAGLGHRCGRHAAVLPFSADIRRSGRIGISVSLTPVALRMALASAGDVGTVATSPIPTLPPST